MTDDLVKRLRVPDPCCEEHHTQNEAADRIESLERRLNEHRRNWELAFNANTALEERIETLEQVRDAALAVLNANTALEERIETLEMVRDAVLAALEESGRKRGQTEALLDRAVDALRTIAHLADGERVGGIARAVLAEIEGGKKDE